MTDNTGYCVTRESFIELGVNPKTASREIKEACDRLFSRVITVTTEAGRLKQDGFRRLCGITAIGH